MLTGCRKRGGPKKKMASSGTQNATARIATSDSLRDPVSPPGEIKRGDVASEVYDGKQTGANIEEQRLVLSNAAAVVLVVSGSSMQDYTSFVRHECWPKAGKYQY